MNTVFIMNKFEDCYLKVSIATESSDRSLDDYESINIKNFLEVFKSLYDAIDLLLENGYLFSRDEMMNSYLVERRKYEKLLNKLS